MTDAARRHRSVRPPVRPVAVVGLGLTLSLAAVWAATATPAEPTAAQAPPRTAAAPRPSTGNDGVEWKKLTATQRTALAPLERDWSGMDAAQKLKWIELAQRFPNMPDEERTRIQGRMAEWARMTPAERGKARLLFLQARRAAPENRGARWEDYQALPSDRKEELAARAKAQNTARSPASRPGSGEKSNLVTGPSFALPPKPVAPTVIQARPGATTTLVSKQPSPPPHQQVGLPKIAATPGFIDKNTLLPRRGPQGAATLSVNSSTTNLEPVPRP